MASHHHSCCRWLVASVCPCQPPFVQVVGGIFVVPAHLVESDIIFRTPPPRALCLMVGPNSQVVCELDELMTVVEDVSDQFVTCDECCDPTLHCPQVADCVANTPDIMNLLIENVVYWIGDVSPHDYYKIGIADLTIRRVLPNLCGWVRDTFNEFSSVLVDTECREEFQTINATWVSNLFCSGRNWNLDFGLVPGGNNAPLVVCYYMPNLNDSPLGIYTPCTPEAGCSSGGFGCLPRDTKCDDAGSVMLS